jgi:hypothetical protein
MRPGWKIPNLQKNRKIQGSDQPARAATGYERVRRHRVSAWVGRDDNRFSLGRTNLRLCEMSAGSVSLFADCYLQ